MRTVLVAVAGLGVGFLVMALWPTSQITKGRMRPGWLEEARRRGMC